MSHGVPRPLRLCLPLYLASMPSYFFSSLSLLCCGGVHTTLATVLQPGHDRASTAGRRQDRVAERNRAASLVPLISVNPYASSATAGGVGSGSAGGWPACRWRSAHSAGTRSTRLQAGSAGSRQHRRYAPAAGERSWVMSLATGVPSRLTRPSDSPAATAHLGSAHHTAHIPPCHRPATRCL